MQYKLSWSFISDQNGHKMLSKVVIVIGICMLFVSVFIVYGQIRLELRWSKSTPQPLQHACLPSLDMSTRDVLLDLSAIWVLTGPDHGLAYLLPDRNYDVWWGNSSGNTCSRNHTKYNLSGSSVHHRKVWSFSYHKMGVYDLPATFDYYLHETNESHLQYIGHSHRTTTLFANYVTKTAI